jgi:hypothetical protein
VGSESHDRGADVGARRYRITIRGGLSQRFAGAFEGMSLETGSGVTILFGDIRDQAHLYGVLDRIRDFGLELLSVEEVRA